MKLSFQWKIRIVICAVAVSLTSLGVYFFYIDSYKITLGQLRKNLRDVGHLGTMLLDWESREAIKRLKAIVYKEGKFDNRVINALKPGETVHTLPPERVKEIHASKDFQLLYQKLNMVHHATYNGVAPLKEDYFFDLLDGINNGMVAVYLIIDGMGITLREDIGIYLVSGLPDPIPGKWPGNPIGNMTKVFLSWPDVNKSIYFISELITDDYYHSLSGVVPILDDDGKVIAYLGMDYPLGRELKKLDRLKWLSLILIGASVALSFLLSFFISRILNKPLQQLHDTAVKVSQNDFTAAVDIKTRDEFGRLGKTFNQMLSHIRSGIVTIEEKNTQLSAVIADMHDGVGSILTTIALSSQNKADHEMPKAIETVNRLANRGLGEVRFLMNALEYEDCTFDILCFEVETLASDILQAKGVKLFFDRPEGTLSRHLDFNVFLILQKIFREVFTNIIKHSTADYCTIIINFSEDDCHIYIKDNGNSYLEKAGHCGRGLDNIRHRVNKIGGRVDMQFHNGFQVDITLPEMVFS